MAAVLPRYRRTSELLEEDGQSQVYQPDRPVERRLVCCRSGLDGADLN